MKPQFPIRRPLHSLHSIPKLIILSSLILLFINIFFPLYNNPVLHPFHSPSPLPSTSSSSTSSSSSSSPFSSSAIVSSNFSSPPPPCIISTSIVSSSSSAIVSFNSPSPPTSRIISTSTVASPSSTPTLSSSSPPRPHTIQTTSSSSSSFAPTSSPNSLPTLSPPTVSSSSSSITIPAASSPFIATNTTSTSPPSILTASKSTKITGLGKKCDISKGEWVRDPEAPYYTNTTCWTIQEHQNCMKYGRPDSDFLKWRWKPQGCELPRFDPARFLDLVRGKSMAFVGDSLARNQMQSLMCLLSRVEYPKDISETKDENFKCMFYTNYNFTISIFWSPFLVKAQEAPTKGPSGSTLWNLYLDEADKRWASRIDRSDYVVISGGNWFTRPSMFYKKGRPVGCLYCDLDNVTPLTMHYSHRMAFRTALRAINRRASFRGTTILRSLSPSHFENGEWDKGGDCVRTGPFRSNETRLRGAERELHKAQAEEFRKAERAGRKRGREFRLLDTTGAMLLRPDGHPSRYGHWADEKPTLYNDCVHWCLPGPVDTWNDFLLHSLS